MQEYEKNKEELNDNNNKLYELLTEKIDISHTYRENVF